MSQKTLILVTGASGQVGSTGYHTIKNLIQQGYRVRAFVRTLDDRSARLTALGEPGDVEIFKGDMLDYNSVREAVKGVKRIYFCFPVRDGIVQASIIMARAAREEGIKGLVNMSQAATIDAGFDVKSKMSRDHWFSEQVFDWADIGVIHINPYFFSENYLVFPGPALLQGAAFVPFDPNFKHTPIAAEDLGIVISKLLMNPEPYFGRKIPLTGPPSNTGSWKDHYEIASRITGKPIAFTCIPIEAWAQAASQALNAYAVQHLSAMAALYNRGLMDGHSVSVLDEFLPRDQQTTVEQFFEKHAHLFDAQVGMKVLWGENSAK